MKILRPIGIGILALLPLAVALTLLTAPTPTQPQPTAFAPGPANLDAWRQDLDGQGFDVRATVSDTILIENLKDSKNTLLVIPQPRHTPAPAHQETWRDHLERGGSLLILDGAGTTNPFLTSYQAAITDLRILDPTQEDPRIVHLQATLDGRALNPVHSFSPAAIVLDDATPWETILTAGPHTFLDLDNSGEVDRTDLPGPHVVAVRLAHPSGGTLSVVATTTPFSDRFLQDTTTGNPDIARDIVLGSLSTQGTVVFDESHHGWTRAERGGVQIMTMGLRLADAQPWALWTAAAAILIAGLLLVVRLPSMRPYAPHKLSDSIAIPATRPDDALTTELAWELAARGTGRDVEETRRSGANALPTAVRRDSPLMRALAGEATAEDRAHLIKRYLLDVNEK